MFKGLNSGMIHKFNNGKAKRMDAQIAIKVEHLSKTFKIPHEKISSLRGAFTSVFKKKSFEEFKALDDISFEVKKGEFFGIIGRNGSGKSTLLKILAGIYQPDKCAKGKVAPAKSSMGQDARRSEQFHGVRINGRISPFLELGIGFNPELSGRDNVYLNAIVLGMTRKQVEAKFDDIVKFSELERFIDQKLKNYSSGMQVRLAFAVSIHANREILLMDEVLAVGDISFQKKCYDYFSSIKGKKTVLFVSHDLDNMERFCDRTLVIDNGVLKKIDRTPDALDAYREIMRNK
jgi:ABC-2 type transport system ATP-binding protein